MRLKSAEKEGGRKPRDKVRDRVGLGIRPPEKIPLLSLVSVEGEIENVLFARLLLIFEGVLGALGGEIMNGRRCRSRTLCSA